MRKILAAFVFFLSIFCYADERCDMRSLSYTQRGILEIGGNEDVVNIYVKSNERGAIMQIDSTFGTLCKLGIDNAGEIFLLESQIPFKDDWVKKYVYRDFLIILGFKEKFNFNKFETKEYCKFIIDETYAIKFSDFKILESNKIIPEKIFIKDKNYNLKLNLLNLKNK